jgi:hypothetical protein
MHTANYIVVGLLIACMLLAAAKALPRGKSEGTAWGFRGVPLVTPRDFGFDIS